MFDQPSGSAKPAIVLIHGAWADASSWNGVVRELTGRRPHGVRAAESAAQLGVGCRNDRRIP